MEDFQRTLSDDLITKLKAAPLFAKLKADCENGDVFPAVRGGYMSFYHAGGSLFKFDSNGFSTHIKYAFVPRDDLKGDYVTQEDIISIKPEVDFVKGYDKIKGRCKTYAIRSDEGVGVSKLYKDSPMSKNGKIYLVDIEVAFPKEGGVGKRNTTDRIDIVLYDNEEKQLLFCEAKHFSNKELWAEDGRDPEVRTQLDKYNTQIQKRGEQILWAYKQHFEVIQKLFCVNLNPPEKIYPHCGLFVFGYKTEQEPKIKNLKCRLAEQENHYPIYPKGTVKGSAKKEGVSVDTLYKALTKAKK